jgi:hypothetical protein
MKTPKFKQLIPTKKIKLKKLPPNSFPAYKNFFLPPTEKLINFLSLEMEIEQTKLKKNFFAKIC